MKALIKHGTKTIINKLQSLVTKPNVHKSMKKPKPKQKKLDKNKENVQVRNSDEVGYKTMSFLPQNEEKQSQMDILLLEEKLKEYNHGEAEKSKLLESDIRAQSFSLEKRLARRKFSHNKILARSNSTNMRDKGYSIGVKDESSSEEYSSIMQNGDPKFEDSWNMESKMIFNALNNYNQQNMSHSLYNFTCEEIIVEEVEEEI